MKGVNESLCLVYTGFLGSIDRFPSMFRSEGLKAIYSLQHVLNYTVKFGFQCLLDNSMYKPFVYGQFGVGPFKRNI